MAPFRQNVALMFQCALSHATLRLAQEGSQHHLGWGAFDVARSVVIWLSDLISSQDEKLTVTQDLPVNDGKPHIVHFQYEVTEVKVSSWDAVLSSQSLFVEIPDGLLADGSKEG